jgi:branched-subunit amino acid ABC-type transport system permease component
MADTVKVLGQAALGATTLTDVYTAPSAAVVSTVVVCNRTNTDKTFRLAVAVAGAADATKQYLAYDSTVAANDSVTFTLGVSLAITDVVRAYASAVGVTVNVFGVEVS